MLVKMQTPEPPSPPQKAAFAIFANCNSGDSGAGGAQTTVEKHCLVLGLPGEEGPALGLHPHERSCGEAGSVPVLGLTQEALAPHLWL